MRCPACEQEIPFRKILFAVNPIFIRCPHCEARLRGDASMMILGALVVLGALALAVPGILLIHRALDRPLRWVAYAAFAVVLSAAIGVPMTRVAMRRGRYLVRGKPRSGS